MAIINKGTAFSNGEQLSANKLNDLVDAATFGTDSVDNASTIVNANGAIAVRDSGVTAAKLATGAVTDAKLASGAVTTAKILDDNVTTAKIADANVTFAKLTDVVDDDTMATATNTTLATSESIKAYVDGTVSTSEDGYMKLPSGVIMQWGTLTPSAQLTDVTLPIVFPNACLNVQASIGADFVDSNYDDNSLIWGAFPKSGDLSKIVIMSNIRVSNTAIRYYKMFWQAIGY